MPQFTGSRSSVTFSILTGLVCLLTPFRASAEIDWNDKDIHWVSYDKGLEESAAKHKPVCLILYAEWCPHCRNYGSVFHDPKVVRESKKFVMIRVDVDKEKSVAEYYTPDGGYVPRTMFIGATGALRTDVHLSVPKFQYFYREKDPESILAGMEQALKPPPDH